MGYEKMNRQRKSQRSNVGYKKWAVNPFNYSTTCDLQPVKGNFIPIHTWDGRRRICVGKFSGGVLYKSVKPEHLLRKPPAIALQADAIPELRRLGCREVVATLTSTGERLYAPLDAFERYGFLVNRGYGEQVALPLSRWEHEDCRQGVLF